MVSLTGLMSNALANGPPTKRAAPAATDTSLPSGMAPVANKSYADPSWMIVAPL